MNNAINIDLFRVSGDSKYLDMIFECPTDYYFNSLQLEVRFIENGSFKSKFFDLSAALFDTSISSTCTIKQKSWTVRLPLEKIDITVPAIYIATLKAQPVFIEVINGESFNYALPQPYTDSETYEVQYNSGDYAGLVYEIGESDPLVGYDDENVYGKIYTNCCGNDCSDLLLSELETSMICSDVNYAYKCMLDDILKTIDPCDSGLSDDAIRKYLLLYGHQAALATEDLETAEAYFKIIGNCFNHCGSTERSSNKLSSCNCGFK